MKEVKAYVRLNFLDAIIESLEQAGARDITIVRVDAVGALADFEKDRWHVLRKYAEKYSVVAGSLTPSEGRGTTH
jgi:nitrogen regulatory protein PII